MIGGFADNGDAGVSKHARLKSKTKEPELKRFLILLVGQMTWSVGTGGATAQSNLQIYAPVYGNWCGPNHPVNMSQAGPPVDALDAACMRHDHCVAVQGAYSCGCDVSLLQELRQTPWQNPLIQRDARAIYDAIALIPCNSVDGTTLKQTMFAVDLAYDVVSGISAPLDVFERWRSLFLGY